MPLDEIARSAQEAWDRGATEACLQGGIHPAFTGDYYLFVVRGIKSAVPALHVHAFSALEVWQAPRPGPRARRVPRPAARRRPRVAPGTAAEVLDDEVRAMMCPDKISTEQWLEVHAAVHRVGLRSTKTIMYGAVEGRSNWARHCSPRELRRADGRLHGIRAPPLRAHGGADLPARQRPAGPTFAEALIMHAVGARAAPVDHQRAGVLVELGLAGAAAALAAGVNDLGGTLMNE